MKLLVLIAFSLTSLNLLAGQKFTTLNIRNFDYDPRYHYHTDKELLAKMLQEEDADILAVQEIVRDRLFDSFVSINLPDYGLALSECGGANDQKLGLVYKKEKYELLEFKEDLRITVRNSSQTPRCDSGSRPAAIAIFRDLKTQQKLAAISVHLKSGGGASNIEKRFYQLSVLQKIRKELLSEGIEHIVVMGDFNSTQYIYHREEYKRFKDIVASMNMTDVSSDVKCTSYWWGGINDDIQYPSQLDHVLISDSLLKNKEYRSTVGGHCQVNQCQPTAETQMGATYDGISDHCPVSGIIK